MRDTTASRLHEQGCGFKPWRRQMTLHHFSNNNLVGKVTKRHRWVLDSFQWYCLCKSSFFHTIVHFVASFPTDRPQFCVIFWLARDRNYSLTMHAWHHHLVHHAPFCHVLCVQLCGKHVLRVFCQIEWCLPLWQWELDTVQNNCLFQTCSHVFQEPVHRWLCNPNLQLNHLFLCLQVSTQHTSC